MKYTLRKYQQQGKDFIQDRRRCCLFWSMGLGKTICVLSSLTPEMLPALVVAPLRVARHVWPDEIDKFRPELTYAVVHGKYKREALHSHTDIKVINPEGLQYLFSECEKAGNVPFKTVIVDESSLFKNCTTKRWKLLRGLIDAVDNRILLTGTPSPNGYADLYGQISLLGLGTFPSYNDFIDAYFKLDFWGNPVLIPGNESKIEDLIRSRVLRKELSDEIDLPPITYNDVHFDLSKVTMDRYQLLEDGIEQVNENAYNSLRTCCSGFLYKRDEIGRRYTEHVHDEKLKLLAELIEQNPGEPHLVMTNFRAERDRLVAQYNCPYLDGGTKSFWEDEILTDWNAGRTPILVANPGAMGHGLNLQTGGSQVIWFSLPDNLEYYLQANARLHRSGQTKPVSVHHLIASGTIDVTIRNLIEKKDLSQQSLLAALKEQIA